MRAPSRRCRREPRPHERIWQDRCVDKYLKDEWLLSLNGLQAFDLISICEGHVKSRRPYPHVNLRLKEECFPIVSGEWHRSAQIMCRVIDDILSSEDSDIEIGLRDVFRKRQGRYSYRQNFTARIRCLGARRSESMEDGVVKWFEAIISEIYKLDKFLFDLCKDISKSPPTAAGQ